MESNRRFGHLVTIELAEKPPYRPGHSPKWLCQCDCGRQKPIRKADLLSGNSTSCGCWTWHKTRKHGRYQDPLYRLYYAMKQRCSNPNVKAWKLYGGRGITVCERWATFDQFAADMGSRPSPKHGLDRINPDLGYSPENVRWATQQEQMQNLRTNVLVTAQGVTLSIGAWARRAGIPPSTLQARIAAGWDHERAVVPAKPRKRRINQPSASPG